VIAQQQTNMHQSLYQDRLHSNHLLRTVTKRAVLRSMASPTAGAGTTWGNSVTKLGQTGRRQHGFQRLERFRRWQ
jgi:hypothetical protein